MFHLTAVSYTHLDVYKRQHTHSPQIGLRVLKNIINNNRIVVYRKTLYRNRRNIKKYETGYEEIKL